MWPGFDSQRAFMPKIPEISVGNQMERSVSVSSDRNIRDHLWRWSTYFGWNIPTEILTNRFFALIREFGKGIKSGKSHSYWLARFNRKMSFHFPSVFPLIFDRSVWHNGKHPQTLRRMWVEFWFSTLHRKVFSGIRVLRFKNQRLT